MKTVIITGAAGNMGAAVTREFLEKQYRVVAVVANEKDRSEMPSHPNLVVELANLTDEKGASELVQHCINKFQVIDAALLLVGGFKMGDLEHTSVNDIREQIALNFETAYNITKPLFAHLVGKKRGSIIFIGARPAIQAAQGKAMIAYSLSKSLLFKFAEFLNESAKGMNVAVSVVVPSTLDTPLNRKSMPDSNPEDWVKPTEVAETLEFLVSDKSKALKETVLKIYNNA